MPQSKLTVREGWARLGAEARLQQLETERAEILAAFPDLKGGAVVAPRRSTRVYGKLTPAIRRKMSTGMRKYWAKRKAAEKKG